MFDNTISQIQTEELGFCGCGLPTENLIYIRDSLRLIKEKQDHTLRIKYFDKTWYENWKIKVEQFFKSYQAEYFMWYWLDQKEYMGHGGSLPGWLSLKGKEFLSKLESLELDLELEIEKL